MARCRLCFHLSFVVRDDNLNPGEIRLLHDALGRDCLFLRLLAFKAHLVAAPVLVVLLRGLKLLKRSIYTLWVNLEWYFYLRLHIDTTVLRNVLDQSIPAQSLVLCKDIIAL